MLAFTGNTFSRVWLPVFSFFLLFGSNAVANDGFHIKANAPSFTDGSKVYIYALDNSMLLDSTVVVAGKFELTGHVNEKAIHVRLTINEFRNARKFWLENEEIRFDLTGVKCADAKISGSKTQIEEDTLNAWISPIAIERERLNIAYYGDTSAVVKDRISRQLIDLDSLEKNIYQKFIKSFSFSLVSASLLSVYCTVWGKNETTTLFQLLTPENRKTNYGKDVSDFIKLNISPKVGDPYVDFQQVDTSGRKISVSNFDGNVVLLEFWASWCFGCMIENPKLMSVYDNYKDKGFRIVAVSLDNSRDAWLNGIRANGLVCENISDLHGAKNEGALIYGVGAIPDNFLIDKNGIIRGRNVTADNLPSLLDGFLK